MLYLSHVSLTYGCQDLGHFTNADDTNWKWTRRHHKGTIEANMLQFIIELEWNFTRHIHIIRKLQSFETEQQRYFAPITSLLKTSMG